MASAEADASSESMDTEAVETAGVAPIITSLVAAEDWDTLRKTCSDTELDEADPTEVHQHFYTVYLLTLLIVGDLDNARHLWRRTPQKVKEESQELRSAWVVGQKLWQRKFADVFETLKHEWSSDILPLAKALEGKTRTRILDLVANAYSDIYSQDLAGRVGLSEEEIFSVAEARGWGVDRNKKLISPVRATAPARRETGLPQLKQLAEYVISMEQHP